MCTTLYIVLNVNSHACIPSVLYTLRGYWRSQQQHTHAGTQSGIVRRGHSGYLPQTKLNEHAHALFLHSQNAYQHGISR